MLDESLIFDRLATELLVGQVVSDGVAFEDVLAIGRGERGDFAQGELGQEFGGLVGFAQHKFRSFGGDFDFGAGIFGGDQRLVGAEIFRVGVKGTGHHLETLKVEENCNNRICKKKSIRWERKEGKKEGEKKKKDREGIK